MDSKVRTGQEAGVLTLTICRPEVRNALDYETKDLLSKGLRHAAQSEDVRVVVIEGEGVAFSSGEDLKSHQGEGERSIGKSLREGLNPLVTRMRRLPKPIIAKIQGVAAGAGFSLALAADLRLGSEKARFFSAFTKIGLIPDSGMNQTLPRIVGLGRAYEIAVTGRVVEAEEALQAGILNRLVPEADLDAEVARVAAELAAGPTYAFGMTKLAMDRGFDLALEDLLAWEADAQEAAGRTRDHREGVAAFFEKRPPTFGGS